MSIVSLADAKKFKEECSQGRAMRIAKVPEWGYVTGLIREAIAQDKDEAEYRLSWGCSVQDRYRYQFEEYQKDVADVLWMLQYMGFTVQELSGSTDLDRMREKVQEYKPKASYHETFLISGW